MEVGYIDDFDLERIIKAVEEEMEIEPIEKPEVVVKNLDSDSDSAHVVNLNALTCTCDDYEYNCTGRESETQDEKYCKHVFNVVFKRNGLI